MSSRAQARDIFDMLPPIRGASSLRRQLSELAASPKSREIVGVFVDQYARAITIENLSVAWYYVLRLPNQLLKALQGLQVSIDPVASDRRRDLNWRKIVPHDENARPRYVYRHAIDSVAVGAMQLELLFADRATPRHRQSLERSKREWTSALDQQRFVERSELTLSYARCRSESFSGTLGASEREAGEGKPAQQMIPVGVRGEQPTGTGKPSLLEQRWKGVELVWEHWRVDHERLSSTARFGCRVLFGAAAHDDAVALQNCASDEQNVGVQGKRPHALGDAEQLGSVFQAGHFRGGLLL